MNTNNFNDMPEWTDADEALMNETDAFWTEYERSQSNPFDLPATASNSLKMTMKEFRALTIDAAIKLLDIVPGEHTYIYFSTDWELTTIEKPDRHSDPADELVALGSYRQYR